ncbi:hypothetical protein HPB47_011617 [Ixodes persulcatus]|uniref:Uncharacterized protein n=1 Tax=Ixodes persulcatus TaxID=34615 RepID=A0AC60NVT5_IXOPE|nr:hypothetical protein HPB47_011617 [Ixodes persulcatus]
MVFLTGGAHLGRAWTRRPPRSTKAAILDTVGPTSRAPNRGRDDPGGGTVVEPVGINGAHYRVCWSRPICPCRSKPSAERVNPDRGRGTSLKQSSPVTRWPRRRQTRDWGQLTSSLGNGGNDIRD